MSLDKAIEHGQEFRKQYRKSQAFDRTCRPGRRYVNKCPYCQRGRMVGDYRLHDHAKDAMQDDGTDEV